MLFFCLFQCFKEKEYHMESKWNETFRSVIFEMNVIQRTWSASQEAAEAATRKGGCPPVGRAPCPVGPSGGHRRTSSSYISLHTPKTSEGKQNIISTTVTFCIREIPSWGLHQHFTGEGIDHGGPLHQHPCPSDEL